MKIRQTLNALALASTATLGAVRTAEAAGSGKVHPDVIARLAEEGSARVLVRLAVDVPKERFTAEDLPALEAAVRAARDSVRAKLGEAGREYDRYRILPIIAVEADAATIATLEGLTAVRGIRLDGVRRPSLDVSVPHIGGPAAWRHGGTQGVGSVVAVLDTGFDVDHPFIADRLVGEACFSTTDRRHGLSSLCPGGEDTESGPGSAAAPDDTVAGFDHGTHVAGIAMGQDARLSGVAPAASLLAVQVFTRSERDCEGEPGPCTVAFDSDLLLGLEHVVLRRVGGLAVRSVNMSLSAERFTGGCEDRDSGLDAAVALLRLGGTSVVAASGNSAWTGSALAGLQFLDGIGSPACIPGVISVGSVTTNDEIALDSQASWDLDILAPGVSIESSVPDGGFAWMSGTSMAAPHVAGALAVLADAFPLAPLADREWALLAGGVPLVDDRSGEDRTFPRLDLAASVRLLAQCWPFPVPPVPSQLAVVGVPNRTDVTLAFNDGGDHEVRFEVSTRRATDLVGFVTVVPPTDFGVVRQTALVTGLIRGTAYLSKVRACDTDGRCSDWSPEVPFTTFIQLPPAPTGFAVTGTTSFSVNLAWNALAGLTRWELGYSGGTAFAGTLRPAANATSASVLNRYPGETYRFTLRGCNGDGCGPSVQVTGTTRALQPIPAAPANLVLLPSAVGQASLSWTDRSSNELGFEVWRAVATPGYGGTEDNPTWGRVLTPAANATSAVAPALPTINYYKVRACNVGGCSAYSNVVTRF